MNPLQRLIVEIQHDALDYSLMCRLCEWTGTTPAAVLFTGGEQYRNTDYEKKTATDHGFSICDAALYTHDYAREFCCAA